MDTAARHHQDWSGDRTAMFNNGYLFIHMDKMISNIFNGIGLEILALYLSDYTTRMHVRQISRVTSRNHRTVSLALKRLERQGIVKHEDVGKNKQYSLNLDNVITRDCLKNAESLRSMEFLEKHFVLKKLLTELSQDMRDTALMLFGSYAKGEETEMSDIDLLILKDENEGKMLKDITEFAARHNINIQIQKTTKEQFELAIREKDTLVVEIMKHHVILNNAELFIDIFWRYFHER